VPMKDSVGRHLPMSVLPVNGGGFGGKRPSLARSAMMPAAAGAPTAPPGAFGARPGSPRDPAYVASRDILCARERVARKSRAAFATAASGEPEAPGIST